MSDRFLTVAEVAERLKVSTMTIYRLINANKLAAVKVGKSYRINEDMLNHYLSRRK